MKTCSICNEDKELVEFYKHKATKDGLDGRCKPCKKAYVESLKYRTDLKVPAVPKVCNTCGVMKSVSGYNTDIKNSDGLRKECRECKRDITILKRYGLTPADHTDLYDSQQGRCDICLKDIEQYAKSTHCDHSHSSGKVRGLLCSHCNLVLGHAMDIPEVLRRAANYLEKHK